MYVQTCMHTKNTKNAKKIDPIENSSEDPKSVPHPRISVDYWSAGDTKQDVNGA